MGQSRFVIPRSVLEAGAAWLIDQLAGGPPPVTCRQYAVEPEDVGAFLAAHPDALPPAAAAAVFRAHGHPAETAARLAALAEELRAERPGVVVFVADFKRPGD